jgi:hypothetical protein
MFLHALTPDLIDAEVVRAAIKALGGQGNMPPWCNTAAPMPAPAPAADPLDRP